MSTRWCFTHNLNDDQWVEIEELYLNGRISEFYASLANLCNSVQRCKYIKFGLEFAPETGQPHLQGYVIFERGIGLATVKQRMSVSQLFDNTTHYEIMEGTIEQNDEYVEKEGEWMESGEHPVGRGHRSDLDDIWSDLREGASETDVMESHFTDWARYHKAIGRARYLLDLQKQTLWREVETTVIWGNAGVGKTRLALSMGMEKYGELPYILYPGNSHNVWFDGYQGQKCLVLDDFTGWLKLTFLLRLLDGYPLNLEVKGGSVAAQWEMVIITSNQNPGHWYGWDVLKQHDDGRALFRRINFVDHLNDYEPGRALERDIDCGEEWWDAHRREFEPVVLPSSQQTFHW